MLNHSPINGVAVNGLAGTSSPAGSGFLSLSPFLQGDVVVPGSGDASILGVDGGLTASVFRRFSCDHPPVAVFAASLTGRKGAAMDAAAVFSLGLTMSGSAQRCGEAGLVLAEFGHELAPSAVRHVVAQAAPLRLRAALRGTQWHNLCPDCAAPALIQFRGLLNSGVKLMEDETPLTIGLLAALRIDRNWFMDGRAQIGLSASLTPAVRRRAGLSVLISVHSELDPAHIDASGIKHQHLLPRTVELSVLVAESGATVWSSFGDFMLDGILRGALGGTKVVHGFDGQCDAIVSAEPMPASATRYAAGAAVVAFGLEASTQITTPGDGCGLFSIGAALAPSARRWLAGEASAEFLTDALWTKTVFGVAAGDVVILLEMDAARRRQSGGTAIVELFTPVRPNDNLDGLDRQIFYPSAVRRVMHRPGVQRSFSKR